MKQTTLDPHPPPLPSKEYLDSISSAETGISVRINNRLVGKIYDTIFGRIYMTERRKYHIFRKWNSIGISYDILKELKRRGVKKIVIKMTDRDCYLISDLEDWLWENQRYYWDKLGEIQNHLPLSKMRCI